jgi:hypothetical protein
VSASVRLRDMIPAPVWLRDRPGFRVGYSFLWSIAAVLDTAIELALEGAQAGWPGLGTPTALPYIGRTRGIVRGIGESDAHYARRLRAWLETHGGARTAQMAIQIHEYLPGNPAVRIIARGRPDVLSGAGNWVPASSPIPAQWVSVDAAGVVTKSAAAWDWDSVSNPERKHWWSELWIVIYPTPYTVRAGTLGGLTGDDGYGLGLMIPHDVVDTLRAILADWKGDHTRIRAVLWTSDVTAYNPAGTGIKPDGTWGEYQLPGSDPRVAGGRDLTVTRYQEPSPGAGP